MALSTKVGSFTKPTVTGNQSITGVGFTPKVIMVWTAGANLASGVWTSYYFSCLGFSSGPTNSYSCASNSRDAVTTANTSRAMTTNLITIVDSGTLYDQASLVSFDADGFTINWSVINNGVAGAVVFNYLVLGGTDITNAKVVNWTGAGANGNQAVTGVGFKPDLVFHAANGMSAGTSGTVGRIIFGAMNKHGQQWSNGNTANSGVNPSDTARYQQTDACYVAPASDGSTVQGQAHFSSMDTDGFSVYWSTFLGAPTISLCIKGVSSKLGTFTKTTATQPASQSVTHVGFQPKAILNSHVTDAAKSGPAQNAYWGLGVFDGTSQRAVELGDNDAVSPTQAKSIYRTDGVINIASTAGSTAVVGSATSLDGDGFTLSFNPNTAGTHEILYLALGDAGVDTFPQRVDSQYSVGSSSVATSSSHQRHIDRFSNGTIVTMTRFSDATSCNFLSSADGGKTWNNLMNFAGYDNGSMFIDIDDYVHVVWKQADTQGGRTVGYLYYMRGTPDAGRTTWTWSTPLVVNSDIRANYPDLIAHREGTGWAVHIVDSAVVSGQGSYAEYTRVSITSAGVITWALAPINLGGPYAGITLHSFPSIDFNHTGDGKTVAGATPNLYTAWSAGAAGTGFGIRFKKGVYSGGAWTWPTEREIDSTRFNNGSDRAMVCFFDGTRVVLAANELTDGIATLQPIAYERDAADTTTTVRNPTASTRLLTGSASYDAAGNIYILGMNITSGQQLAVLKYTRSSDSWAITNLEPVGGTVSDARPYVSTKRGFSNNKVEWVYVHGNNTPYTVKYDYLPTTVIGLFIKKVKSVTDLYREKMRARGFNI